jgi:hypothetical protein
MELEQAELSPNVISDLHSLMYYHLTVVKDSSYDLLVTVNA